MATKTSIPITKPLFGAEELARRAAAARDGLGRAGPVRAGVRGEVLARSPAPAHAVATSSCTTALHIAVAALGLKPGDEVIVPAFTWVSTANVVEYMGAKPVFCDVDLATFNIDPAALEPLVTDADGRHPARAPVRPLRRHGSGSMELARKHDLWVVEDAPARSAAGTAAGTPARSATSAASASTRASRSRPARAG